LSKLNVPYVIENVPRSPLINPVRLCGTALTQPVTRKGRTFQIQRHRLFEANFEIAETKCNHVYPALPVYGHVPGGGCNLRRYPELGGKGCLDFFRSAMGVEWATNEELSESIPPAFTKYVGYYLMKELQK
jgi:DNA (cytosine-5)-methyltransferase 1